jgi:hypothetical protein
MISVKTARGSRYSPASSEQNPPVRGTGISSSEVDGFCATVNDVCRRAVAKPTPTDLTDKFY